MITRDEWTGSQASFLVHDWNRDGVLAGVELQTGGVRSDDVPVEDANQPGRGIPNWSRRTFDALDRDGNGQVSATEWRYDAETFRRIDRNGDRLVTLTEFTSTDVDDDRDDRFEYLDMNHDGYLSGTEWHGSAATFEWLDVNRGRRLSREEVVGDSETAQNRVAVRRGDSPTELRVPANAAWPLIARVGQSTPFPVIVQEGRVRMPQPGRLFLGINDDNVSDNRGEFEVTIQSVR